MGPRPLLCQVRRISPLGNLPFSVSFGRNRQLDGWGSKVIALASCPWETRLKNRRVTKILKIRGQCKLFSSQSLLHTCVAGAGSVEQMWHCFAGVVGGIFQSGVRKEMMD